MMDWKNTAHKGDMISNVIVMLCSVVLTVLLLTGVVQTTAQLGKTSEECLLQYGGIELNYTKGSQVTYSFDLCAVIRCGANEGAWRAYELYVCYQPEVTNQCNNWGYTTSPWCRSWEMVKAYTGYWYHSSSNQNTLALQRDFRFQSD